MKQSFTMQNFFDPIFLLDWTFCIVDAHFGKPSRKKKPSNMGRKELVSG